MANISKLMRILLLIGNFLCIIMAIIILSMSIGHWQEYAGATFSILVAFFGLFVVCLHNHIVIMGYGVLVGIDMLLLLANGVYLAIIKSQWSDYCFNYEGDHAPKWGCYDWRNGHYERATGVMVCLFIAFLLRALNFASACLLARAVYEDIYDDGVGEPTKSHDLEERGRQF